MLCKRRRTGVDKDEDGKDLSPEVTEGTNCGTAWKLPQDPEVSRPEARANLKHN